MGTPLTQPVKVDTAPTRPWQVARFTMNLALVIVAAGCGGDGASSGSLVGVDPAPDRRGPLIVYVVNYPLMYFAERIGGDRVDVRFPAPGGVDPAFWQPDAEMIAAYQGADLIVRNGAGYAKWTALASLPDSKTVYSSAAFFDDVIVEEGAVTHSHGPEGDHSHGEIAFTTWLDARQATLQAEAIAAAVAESMPDMVPEAEANMAALGADLEALDARLAAAASQLGGAPLLGSHPLYQYLARRYGLNLRSVHFEPGEMPAEEAWDDLARLLTEHRATAMLWEAEPLAETAERLRQMGIESIVFDPAGNRPADGDFLDVMRQNAANLERLEVR